MQGRLLSDTLGGGGFAAFGLGAGVVTHGGGLRRIRQQFGDSGLGKGFLDELEGAVDAIVKGA